MSTRTLGLEKGWIVRFHIVWREERVSARTLGPERSWIVTSNVVWREERVSARILGPRMDYEIPHRLERGTGVSEDARP